MTAIRRQLAHGGDSVGLEVGDGVSAENVAFLRELGLGHTIVTRADAPVPHPKYVDYAREPVRAPVLRVNKDKPYNAEPLLQDLTADGFITSDKVARRRCVVLQAGLGAWRR
jgi:hypothetical protein